MVTTSGNSSTPIPSYHCPHGHALDLAIDIIAACDARYAASNKSFSIKVRPYSLIDFVRIIFVWGSDVGLAADIGTFARLPKLTGNLSLVHELAYSTRTFSVVEAKKLGLVSRVVWKVEDKRC